MPDYAVSDNFISYNRAVIFDIYNKSVIFITYNRSVIKLRARYSNEADMLPITSPEILGKVLRRYRKDLGLTQSEAGKKFNLPQKTVSRIESGISAVHLESLFKYMSALNLEIHLQPREPSSDEALW